MVRGSWLVMWPPMAAGMFFHASDAISSRRPVLAGSEQRLSTVGLLPQHRLRFGAAVLHAPAPTGTRIAAEDALARPSPHLRVADARRGHPAYKLSWWMVHVSLVTTDTVYSHL